MKESKIQRDGLDHAEQEWGAFTFKVVAANKSGIPDGILCVPLVITQEMVGRRIGVFAAAEFKRPKEDERDLQGYQIEKIKEAGGFAGVCRSVEDVRDLLLTILGPEI